MKRVNHYFFGGDAHWSDYAWFYGTLLFGFLIAILVINQLN